MKTFGACLMSSGLTIILMLLLIPIDQGERCETMQIAYEKTIELQDQKIQQEQDTADFLLSRIAVNQQRIDKLQEALGKAVTEKAFLMSEVQSKTFELAEIQALAAKVAPLEQAGKAEAAANHSWVPAWWKQFKIENVKQGMERLAGKVHAPRIP